MAWYHNNDRGIKPITKLKDRERLILMLEKCLNELASLDFADCEPYREGRALLDEFKERKWNAEK